MIIFESEPDILSTIDKYDEIIKNRIAGKITFQQFLDQYNDFYDFYALDGHESDLEEREPLKKYQNGIVPHREVIKMLSGLCSDEDTKKSYIRANRFGSAEALKRPSEISKKHF